jgi:hypothetical protein
LEPDARRPGGEAPLRLGDLVPAHGGSASRIARAPAAIPQEGPAIPAEAAPPEGGTFGRVFDALVRIEEHIGVRGAKSDAAPQWLDEEDDLADRIQDILRRQVRRHGIDAP